MHMFVAMDIQLTGAKSHKKSQTNYVTIHNMLSHNFVSTVQSIMPLFSSDLHMQLMQKLVVIQL